MASFSPLLVLALIWLLIGVPLSKLSKAAKKSTRTGGQQTTRRTGEPAGTPRTTAMPQPQPEPFRPGVLQPTVSVTEHDDSIYMGSLNAVTGEGYDPCHNEQLAPLSAAESELPAAEAAAPGLQLNWTGSEIVRGLVISEILKRK